MKTLRRILCVPVAALLAVAMSLLWASVFTGASFSERSVLFSAVGLAPLFLGRFIPVALFVILGTAIAPAPRIISVFGLGALGGVFGWPLALRSDGFAARHTFHNTEIFGAIAGASIGILVGLLILRKNTQKSNPEGCVRPERSGAVNTTIVEQARGGPETKPQSTKD